MPAFKNISTQDGVKKWSVVFDLPTLDGSRKQKRLSGFNSRREAELAYIAFRGTYDKKIAEISKETFDEVFRRYLQYQETRIKESSFIDIMKNYGLHIYPTFGSLPIDQIKPKDIIAWQTILNSKGYSYKYKNKLLSYIKMFFNYCINIEGILRDSPAKKQLKFSNNQVKKEMLIYPPAEYIQFRSVIEKLQDFVLFDLLYFTGCRKGELMALQWKDLNENILSITKTYSRKTKDGKWKLTSPKSKNSIRDIMLPAFLVNELTELKTNKNASETDFILGDEFPTNERYLDLARNKYYVLAEVKRIRIHDFRHSHVSYLISENIDILTIAKRLGDKVETILSTYAHLMPSKQLELLDKLNTLVIVSM